MTTGDAFGEATRRKRSLAAIMAGFGTAEPQLTRFPHVVFPTPDGVLRAVAAAVGCDLGVWGNSRPLVDARGEAYLEPPDSRAIADFKLWKLPENQTYALGRGGAGNQCFTMVISADTPEEALATMYDGGIGTDEFDYDRCIQLLPQWLCDLNWAYVPLRLDGEFAIFVAWLEHSDIVRRVAANLAAAGVRPLFKVKEVDGRQEWLGPLYLESWSG